MKRMSIEGKLHQAYTNHSLRAYVVTKLFHANVSEKVIMEWSGHHSTEGVWKYQRTNILQEIQTCTVLDSRCKKLPEPPLTQLLHSRALLVSAGALLTFASSAHINTNYSAKLNIPCFVTCAGIRRGMQRKRLVRTSQPRQPLDLELVTMFSNQTLACSTFIHCCVDWFCAILPSALVAHEQGEPVC